MPDTPRPRRVLTFHPILFAAFPVLALYAGNISVFPLNQLPRPLVDAIFKTAVVWIVLGLILRNVRKAAVVSTVAALAYFSYGRIQNLLPQDLHFLVPLQLLICISGLFVLMLRSQKSFLDTTRVLNLASIVLVAPSLWTISTAIWSGNRAGVSTNPDSGPINVALYLQPEPAGTTRLAKPPENRPDIYYIILDAYGRADRLKTFYGLDNRPFVKALEQRGFFVPKASAANYDQTTLCLSSSLNMNYLRVPPGKEKDNPTFRPPLPLRRMIDENRVAEFLRKQGYKYVNVWAGLEETRVQTADIVLNGETKASSFENETRGLSAGEATAEAQRDRYDQHRDRIIGAFNDLRTAAKLPAPKFVFAHILAPHPPFVLGPHGESLYPKGPLALVDGSWLLNSISRDDYRRGYSGQLHYVNARILEAIDLILKQSRRPPVIVVQGDHGSRMNLDWDSLEKTDLREPFSILNAYYVPKSVRDDLGETITPVNTFRILLSRLFGTNLPRLPDRSFYSMANTPFDLTEVTQRLAQLR